MIVTAGFNQVYKGTYVFPDDGCVHEVALKCAITEDGDLSSTRLCDGLARKEAHLYMTLRHPTLMRCWGWLMLDGRRTLVLDFTRGGTLDTAAFQMKWARRELPHTFLLLVLRDVAAALAYLHGSHGASENDIARDDAVTCRYFAHGDVHLSNVFLNRPPEEYSGSRDIPPIGAVARLTDLGTARVFCVEDGRQTIPALEGVYLSLAGFTWPGGQVVTCPSYTSPEALDKFEWTPESDVWSWGIMAFELVAGQRVWDVTDLTNFAQLRSRIRSLASQQDAPKAEQNSAPSSDVDMVQWPDTIPSHFKAVQELAKTALRPKPADRPSSRHLLGEVEQLIAVL